MKVFLTGSRVYGSPREDSDLDIAVLCEEASELTLLRLMSGKSPAQVKRKGRSGGPDNDSLYFGKLNLICFTNKVEFEAWRRATDSLKMMGPVERQHAVDFLKEAVAAAFRKAGQEYVD